jgi:transposase InsO family protein
LLADLTWPIAGEGWFYLSEIFDAYFRKNVGWSMREARYTEIALAALIMAIERLRPAPALIR